MTGLLPTAYPQIVQGLHAAFTSHLRMDMAHSPYLDSASRNDLEGLLDGGAAPREVADELFFALITGWGRLSHEKGADVRVHSSFGVESLFSPMEKVNNIVAASDEGPAVGRVADSGAIAREISRHHPSANRYLEVRYPHGTPGLETFYIIHAELNVYGLYLYATQDNDVVLRIPSMTMIESALKYCLGKRSLTPCFAPGEVEPMVVNELHKSGHHPIGEPLRRSRMHGRVAEPADYTIHDLGHLIRSSIQLSVMEQRTSSLFCESGVAFLKNNVKLRHLWTLMSEDFGHLMNLEIGPGDERTLAEIMAKARRFIFAIYGQETVDGFFGQYQAKVDRFFKTEERRDADLHRELNDFRGVLQLIRTGRYQAE